MQYAVQGYQITVTPLQPTPVWLVWDDEDVTIEGPYQAVAIAHRAMEIRHNVTDVRFERTDRPVKEGRRPIVYAEHVTASDALAHNDGMRLLEDQEEYAMSSSDWPRFLVLTPGLHQAEDPYISRECVAFSEEHAQRIVSERREDFEREKARRAASTPEPVGT